jgi:aarF domain-containing kinase
LPLRLVHASARTGKQVPKKDRRKRVLLASVTGGGVVATAVAFNDEAKYVAGAAQRTGRVVSTLFICINEYVILERTSRQ